VPSRHLVNTIGLRPSALDDLRAVAPAFTVESIDDPEGTWPIENLSGDVEVLFGYDVPSDLDRTPRLAWLQVGSTGVTHMDLARIADRGITVTNASGVHAVAMAEYVIGWLLHIAKRNGDHLANQATRTWPIDAVAAAGSLLRDQTILVVGYGSIGREVARLASAFGMHVLAVKRRPEIRHDSGYRYPATGDVDGGFAEVIGGVRDMPDLARRADFMAVCLPLTPATTGLVDRATLRSLPRHAWVVNVGRGPTIDMPELDALLAQGAIGGAVLDVFETEPLPVGDPLWDRRNAIITPHASGNPARVLEIMEPLLVENLRLYATGQPLLNVVDLAQGY
jgi:phosphoglycerate dehydrogenase-like enzyme